MPNKPTPYEDQLVKCPRCDFWVKRRFQGDPHVIEMNGKQIICKD